MATITGDNLNDLQHYGQYGNFDVADGGKTLAAAQIADTVDLIRIEGPVRFEDAHYINAALGAGSIVSLGWRYADGTAGGGAAALIVATATNAAGRVNSAVAPQATTKAVIVYATVTGAAATGRLDAVVKYRALGGK
jgi:hypothetical protein